MSPMSYFDIEFHDDELESVPSLRQVRQPSDFRLMTETIVLSLGERRRAKAERSPANGLAASVKGLAASGASLGVSNKIHN